MSAGTKFISVSLCSINYGSPNEFPMRMNFYGDVIKIDKIKLQTRQKGIFSINVIDLSVRKNVDQGKICVTVSSDKGVEIGQSVFVGRGTV